MLSQADLETELWEILSKVRRIPPSDRAHDAFHQRKGEAADNVLALLDKVRGVMPRQVQKRTSAEIRHAARTAR